MPLVVPYFGTMFAYCEINFWLDVLFTDIDECLENRHDCSDFADCKNTIGGFQCSCDEGFHGDGWDCLRECNVCSYLPDMYGTLLI